ncbi:DoxX family protein [Microbacterium arborescens]
MPRTVARLALAALLIAAGAAHLTVLRRGYRIAVPDWATRMLRTDKDMIVVASGAVEVMLGAGLVALPRERRRIAAAIAAFFVAVLPGNIHQWRTGAPAPGLDTDARRFGRLFLQPVLVAWALWAGGPARDSSASSR